MTFRPAPDDADGPGRLDDATGPADPEIAAVCRLDPALASVVQAIGAPPRWSRPEGFATLVLQILEQQLSLAAARAHFDRLAALLGGDITPSGVLQLDDDTLLAAGVSRQKRRYVRALATAVTTGDLDLDGLRRRPDHEVTRALTAVPGIGAWTAACYLLFALNRPDVFPIGDVALERAAGTVLGLDPPPRGAALDDLATRWRPHRSAAARLLWHRYLTDRGRRW